MTTTAENTPAQGGGGGQTSPRKRRRRAPTTGASDDCFTCRDRGISCDRRRPYCTQCLDSKITCSGYKTQLTWGVGVASRGKLRGLSLPVAKSKPAAGEKAARKDSTSTIASSSSKKAPSTPPSAGFSPQTPSQQSSASNVTSAPVSYSFVGVDSHGPAQSAPPFQTNFEWPPQPKFASSDVRNQPIPHHEAHAGDVGISYPRPLKRQALHLDTSDLDNLPPQSSHPMTAGPIVGHIGYSARPYGSPVSPPHLPMASMHHRYGSFSAHPSQSTHVQLPNINPSSAPPNPSQHWINNYPSPGSVSDTSSHVSTPDGSLHHHLPDTSIGIAADQLLAMQQPQSYLTHGHYGSFGAVDAIQELEEVDEEIRREDSYYDPSVIRINQTFNSHERVGNTPELRYLINYYLEVLTPVILAFDAPGNPWRDHVLSLARSSEGLQHAIAALSASNLRMRREHKNDKPRLPPTGNSVHDVSVRRSSEAHARLNDEVDTPGLSIPGAPSAREAYHKMKAIHALDKQLANPATRSDDSILAILLVICLYHMCETGVARFGVQFAGVKKIMNLRLARQAPSKEVNWMLVFFKWFDAMAATVNSRSSQFEADAKTSPFEAGDWDLENLAGCDSRLFAIVSKLGRLNVLSQGKAVDPESKDAGGPMMVPPTFFTPTAGPHAPHMHPDLVFDTSGWAQMTASPGISSDMGPDPRSQFWTEWAQVRQELMNWSFDASYLPTQLRNAAHAAPTATAAADSNDSSSSAQFADNSVADISNISESFRQAALLYTERLAYPYLPSGSEQLQKIVRTGLHYIRLVKSDVCLLWPLFIIGTECVSKSDQATVRDRCWDIQKDSGFFNNIKTLELLEVIWSKADREKRAGNAGGVHVGADEVDYSMANIPGGAEVFRWRREMKTDEGEYIVI